jgi:hypothetical protein
MVDERQDSIRQGIGAPAESEIGQRAAAERRRLATEGAEIGGGLGGTSDVDSAADEATFEREQSTVESDEADEVGGAR